VSLAREEKGGWMPIGGRDNGIGMPAEEQERIFDPFQIGRRLDRPQAGVGAGLAISRDLARRRRGDRSVVSTPGEGSTFTLSLPSPG
jgi:signal transduction histidine kinase